MTACTSNPARTIETFTLLAAGTTALSTIYWLATSLLV
jgi:hypothetical protein